MVPSHIRCQQIFRKVERFDKVCGEVGTSVEEGEGGPIAHSTLKGQKALLLHYIITCQASFETGSTFRHFHFVRFGLVSQGCSTKKSETCFHQKDLFWCRTVLWCYYLLWCYPVVWCYSVPVLSIYSLTCVMALKHVRWQPVLAPFYIQVNFTSTYYWRVGLPGPLCLFVSLLEAFQQTVQRLRKYQIKHASARKEKFQKYV